MIGDRGAHNHAIFLLEEVIIHLKICGSQTNLQQFHNGFSLQGRPFHHSVIVVEFVEQEIIKFAVVLIVPSVSSLGKPHDV
jgi:hypothetical protein